MPEIQRVSYRHEAILNWMVANPNRTLGECALELGYTQAWLSTVIHSDAFQMLYRERMELLGSGVVFSIRDRLCGVAGLALEKTAEKLERGASEDFLATTTKNVLQALGFAPTRTGGPVVQNKVELHLDAEALAAARERARMRFASGQGDEPGEKPVTIHGVPVLRSTSVSMREEVEQASPRPSLPAPSEQLTLAGLLERVDGEAA